MRKVRHINLDMFDEIRGREIGRLTKENALYAILAGTKQSDSVTTRKQLIKNCKKIFKVFWNAIEAEEEVQDLSQMQKYNYMYMTTEMNLLEILTDKQEKLLVFRRNFAI